MLGGTELALHFVANFDDLGDDPVLERGGSLLFNRSPRLEPRYPGEELKAPQFPREDNSQMFPWAMMAAPVLIGRGLFLLTNNPRSLFIMLLFPIMMIGNYLMQKMRRAVVQAPGAELRTALRRARRATLCRDAEGDRGP